MAYGEYELNIHKEPNINYFAVIKLEAEFTDFSEQEETVVVEYTSEAQWYAPLNYWIGIQFGAAYVYESLPNIMTGPLKVRVMAIRGLPGITSPLTMAYATVLALLKALDWQPPRQPSFDPDTAEFTFPRWMHDQWEAASVSPAKTG